jgi:hypothetical protein
MRTALGEGTCSMITVVLPSDSANRACPGKGPGGSMDLAERAGSVVSATEMTLTASRPPDEPVL